MNPGDEALRGDAGRGRKCMSAMSADGPPCWRFLSQLRRQRPDRKGDRRLNPPHQRSFFFCFLLLFPFGFQHLCLTAVSLGQIEVIWEISSSWVARAIRSALSACFRKIFVSFIPKAPIRGS